MLFKKYLYYHSSYRIFEAIKNSIMCAHLGRFESNFLLKLWVVRFINFVTLNRSVAQIKIILNLDTLYRGFYG